MYFYLIIGIILVMYLLRLYVSILNFKNSKSKLPDNVKDVYDQENYIKWSAYNMENFRFNLISASFQTIITLLLFATKAFGFLETLTNNITTSVIFSNVLFILIFVLLLSLLNLPFKYYRSFVIEARYGFNKTTKKTFVTDQIKGMILSGLLIFGLVSLLIWIYQALNQWFFLAAWIAITVISLILVILQTKVFLKLFNKLTPLEDGSLKSKIEAFVQKSGYKIKAISVMDASKRSTKLNAFFSGFGQFKDIVLFDTLVDKLDEDEIIAVLAHEIAHGKYKDVFRMLLQQIIMFAVYIFIISLTVSSAEIATAFGLTGAHFGFGLIVFFTLIEPIDLLTGILTNYLSRVAEYRADRYAATSGYQNEMKTALIKLSKENFSNLTPHPIYIWLYYSHPTLSQRLHNIEATTHA